MRSMSPLQIFSSSSIFFIVTTIVDCSHTPENSSRHMLRTLIPQAHYLVFSSQKTLTSFTLINLLKKIKRLYVEFSQSHAACCHSRLSIDTLERRIGRRMLGSFRVHIIPGDPRAARESLVGRLALLIVIPECSTLPIRVCFGQVCLSPAETYFSNYHTQSAALPSSLEKSLPLLLDQPPPKRRFALFSPFSSPLSLLLSLLPFLFLFRQDLYFHVDDLTRNGFVSVRRKMKLNTHQIPTMLLSDIDRSLTACHRNDLSLLSLTSSVTLFVTHPLSPALS